MKLIRTSLTLAVLALATLVTNPSFAQTNATSTNSVTLESLIPAGKNLLTLTETERSNAIYVIQHPADAMKAAATNVISSTNVSALKAVVTNAKQVVATNASQVMVEILTGVKNAGGEVYNFSKDQLSKGYDFLKEQAPQVVREFLAWQIAKSIVWICVWGSVACLLFYFARQFKLRAPNAGNYKDDYNGFKWLFRVVACITLIITLGINGMVIAKIAIAPRVYIIEYVVDAIHGNSLQDYK